MKAFVTFLLITYVAFTVCQTPVAEPTAVAGRSRTVKFFKAPGMVGVKAVSVNRLEGFTELDAILAGASVMPYPTMAFAYFSSESNVTEDLTIFTAGRFAFAYRFVALIEYEESGDTAGFQHPEDTVVSYYTLGRKLVDWDTLVSREVNSNGQTVRIAEATSTDGVIGFLLAFSGTMASFENKTLNGDNFKFSVSVDYSKANTFSGRNDTRLAVVTVAAGRKSFGNIQHSTGEGLDLPSDEDAITGTLEWDDEVVVYQGGDVVGTLNMITTHDTVLRNDTAATNVNSAWLVHVAYHTVETDATHTLGNSVLYWDPVMGADIDYAALELEAQQSSAAVIAASVLATVSTIMALVL